jgi:hypothetical protein
MFEVIDAFLTMLHAKAKALNAGLGPEQTEACLGHDPAWTYLFFHAYFSQTACKCADGATYLYY